MKDSASKPPSCESFDRLGQLTHLAGLQLKDPPKTPIKVTPPRERQLEESEQEAFCRAMDGVKRSSWTPRAIAPLPDPIAPPSDNQTEENRLMKNALDGKYAFEACDHPEYIEAWISVAGKRFLPNLRNGLYSIQGQIDLHGLNQNEARLEVEQFIVRMACLRSCCVKIIHGRGMNSQQNRAILKEKLQKWLSTRRMSRYVVAYASAPLTDGGVGAVYVLLRRH
jgi:DNA-nicking Smr family endonuclease